MLAMQVRAVDAVREHDAAVAAAARRRRPSGSPSRHGDVIKSVLADALGHAPRRFPADRRRPVLGVGGPLHPAAPVRAARRTTPAAIWPLSSRRHAAPTRAGRRPRTPSVGGSAGTRPRPARSGRRRVGDVSRQVFVYDPPDRFVAGTVGEPGARTFFLQARSGTRVTSVALEKTQVAVLAERIEELLDEVVRRERRQRAGPRGRAGRRRGHRPPGRADRGGVPGRHHEPGLGRRRSGAWSSSAGAARASSRRRGRREAEDRRRGRGGRSLRVTPHRRRRPGRSPSARSPSSAPAGRRARSAGLPLDPEGHICPRRTDTAAERGRLTWPRSPPTHRRGRAARRRRRPRGARPRRARGSRPARRRLQRDPPRAGQPRGRATRLRLQAGRRGAAAVGLPRRHAGRARGGGVRGLRGDRLGHRAADGAAATGPTARAWCSCGSRRLATRTTGVARRWSTGAARRRRARTAIGFARGRGDGLGRRARRAGARRRPGLRRMAVLDAVVNNARPQGRPRAARRPDGALVRRRPRADLQRRGQAAHACCGAGPGEPLDRRGRRGARAAGRPTCDGDGRCGAGLLDLLDAAEVQRHPRPGAHADSRVRPPSRGPVGGWPAIPWPPF